MFEERNGFFFAVCGRDDGDAHAENVLKLFVGGFGENGVFANSERVVAHPD